MFEVSYSNIVKQIVGYRIWGRNKSMNLLQQGNIIRRLINKLNFLTISFVHTAQIKVNKPPSICLKSLIYVNTYKRPTRKYVVWPSDDDIQRYCRTWTSKLYDIHKYCIKIQYCRAADPTPRSHTSGLSCVIWAGGRVHKTIAYAFKYIQFPIYTMLCFVRMATYITLLAIILHQQKLYRLLCSGSPTCDLCSRNLPYLA